MSQTQQNFIMFIFVLGKHVSILVESSSGPSKIQIVTQQCLKCAVRSQTLIFKASVWDPTAHFKHC